MALNKRTADVPDVILSLGSEFSKSDLLEALYDVASLCNRAGSCDDVGSTIRAMVDKINVRREARGGKPFSLATWREKNVRCGACKGAKKVRVHSLAKGASEHPCEACKATGLSTIDMTEVDAAIAEEED